MRETRLQSPMGLAQRERIIFKDGTSSRVSSDSKFELLKARSELIIFSTISCRDSRNRESRYFDAALSSLDGREEAVIEGFRFSANEQIDTDISRARGGGKSLIGRFVVES